MMDSEDSPVNPVTTVDERLEWLARLVPDPALPVAEANAAEVKRDGRTVVDTLDTLIGTERAEDAAWAVARLRPYWLMGGNIEQGRRWTERLLALPRQASDRARARLLEVAGTLAFEQGDEASARSLFTQGREAARDAGDEVAEAFVLGGLARCELMTGNLDAARDAARACEAIYAARADEAARFFPLHVLAYADYIAGDDDAARAGFHRTLDLGRRLGIRARQAQELTNLCSVETRAANLDDADAMGREALEIAVELENELLLPYCVINLAGVASARGEHERAAYLLGAGDALLAASHMELNPGTAIEYRRHRANSAAALGEEGFAERYDAGRALQRERVIAAAREA
jgi:non-specific serine/threonine protein kinase